MCGIAGLYHPSGAPAERRAEIARRMLSRISHRGPDEAGWLVAPHATLGAVRLKIIDLTQGQQPMGEETGRWWIAYNGEIFNYPELRAELEAEGVRFSSDSDTEVALRAFVHWGLAAAERFDGGFAIAIHDLASGDLHLIRDRFGKRPLFLRRMAGAIGFASEIKALAAIPGPGLEWDAAGLAAVLGKWAPTGTECPYAGVEQLPPGGILTLRADGSESLRRYGGFALPQRPSNGPSQSDAAEAARAALREAVRIRLRSDAEVGVLLSGGLDSSIVAHLVRQERSGPFQTFSVAFEDAGFDESPAQAAMVERLGATHTTLRIAEDDIADTFADALWHAEIPQFRTAFTPFFLLSRMIASKGVKVVLSGEGADEVFLGYDIFRETRLRAAWADLSPEARREGLSRLYPYLPLFSKDNLAALEARFARTVDAPDAPLFSHALRFEHGAFAQRLLARPANATAGLEAALLAEGGAAAGAMSRAQWLEFRTLLEGYLLSSQGDRMMFAHGVEPRNPFLSRHVVALAASLPEELLLSRDGREKAILKQAFAKDLPRAILERPKQPYLAPDARAFLAPGGGLRPFAADALAPEALARIDALDADHATRLVAKVARSAPDRISPRESQAFLFLLSIALLTDQMTGGAPAARGDAPLGRIVSQRVLEPA
jgi:asparagine synthase (glutamine-hydrolysing)